MSAMTPLLRAAGRIASPGGSNGKLTVLTYHRILAEHDPLLTPDQIDAVKFAGHMKALAECFNVLPLDQAITKLQQGTLPTRAVCITFDDGYLDNHTVALPILQQHGLKATFFICSGYLNDGLMFNDVILESLRRCQTDQLDLTWLGLGLRPIRDANEKRAVAEKIVDCVKYMSFDEREQACNRLWEISCHQVHKPRLMMKDAHIKSLAEQGMTIGAHTHTHPILARVDLDSARADIEENRRILESLTGQRPEIFAYPNGRPIKDYGAQHVKLVKELGFHSAVSSAWGVATQSSDRHQLPRFAPWESNPKRFVLHLLKNAVLGTRPSTT